MVDVGGRSHLTCVLYVQPDCSGNGSGKATVLTSIVSDPHIPADFESCCGSVVLSEPLVNEIYIVLGKRHRSRNRSSVDSRLRPSRHAVHAQNPCGVASMASMASTMAHSLRRPPFLWLQPLFACLPVARGRGEVEREWAVEDPARACHPWSPKVRS